MSRIAKRFVEVKRAGRRALIPYVTAGDPEAWNMVPLVVNLSGRSDKDIHTVATLVGMEF